MAPPAQLSAWLDANYPCPRVDPEWLDACYAWITAEHHLDPATQLPEIIVHLEAQLLQSDLTDSMSHGTGIPLALLHAPSATLAGPVLVEITALTEVASSALALDQVRATRAERLAAGAGAGDEENEADLEVDGEGPVPNYPRGMLRFELSDGATTLPAIEYRRLPELTLGVTPLGYKARCFMVLRDVLIRRGMAFLEPRCVTHKGHQTEDREALQESDFARGLRVRLGRPEPNPAPAPAQQPAPPAPRQQAAPAQPPPPPPPDNMRSPLREISPPPSPTLPVESHHHSDDEDQPRRRRIPNPPPASALSSSSGPASSSTLVSTTSSYFPSAAPAPQLGAFRLSPLARGAPIDIDSDSDDEGENAAPRPMIPLRGANKNKSAVAPAPRPHQPKVEEPPSDDFDVFDLDADMLNPAFVEELERAERRAGANPNPNNNNNQDNGAASGSSATMHVDEDENPVITIDDDEEMEDKENVPAPQRHVRRRVFGGGDVIDISDSP
ncbi:hypothetical protein C8J57DRAFT_1709377 [Mycena rebaudengoi]|nr:hypothetical protein C8J57DRAFT_1709377 [Mycena rebaudengoi]